VVEYSRVVFLPGWLAIRKLEEWNVGEMECWNDGKMEYWRTEHWNDGIMTHAKAGMMASRNGGKMNDAFRPNIPLFQSFVFR